MGEAMEPLAMKLDDSCHMSMPYDHPLSSHVVYSLSTLSGDRNEYPPGGLSCCLVDVLVPSLMYLVGERVGGLRV